MAERFPPAIAGARTLRDERGFAVPTVLLMMLAVVGWLGWMARRREPR